ncbi:hypothetical protein [Amycolatopsis sp. DSM 110486]|uniref:hypothetical protein n=1 Tax=Amycolatopsis sp. DSM 110486 TaxID=2865832 RepID=UPI001C69AF32|nr:hypothetical protein [Amycolatopsis sp. DSM 110486]QYN17547.1 hypothetical protein K1T34_32700 [Amycolatopsis sp. DSM 110486]
MTAQVPYDRHEQEILGVIQERDEAEAWSDRLAAAIAPAFVRGEHSNGNNPWANAADWARQLNATVARLAVERDAALAKLAAVRTVIYEGGQDEGSRCRRVRELVPYASGPARYTPDADEEPELPGPGGFPYRQHPHPYCGSNSERQSVGDPGHCEDCCSVGHIVAHPDYGCADVGCNNDHTDDSPEQRNT